MCHSQQSLRLLLLSMSASSKHEIDARYQSWLHAFRADPTALLLFGCSETGKKIAGANPTAQFVEDDPSLSVYDGRQVINLASTPLGVPIVSTVSGIQPRTTLERLWDLGHQAVDCFWFAKHFMPDLEITPFWVGKANDRSSNSLRYENLKNLLEDGESKFTLDALLQFREELDLWCLKDFDVTVHKQYLEPFLNLGPHERFVDIGGYTGDTSLSLLELVGTADEIRLFEPSSGNVKAARQSLRGFEQIHFYQVALGREHGEGRVVVDASASRLEQGGEEVVQVRTLDSFRFHPTFIKIDVEGDELNVLEGAAETIRSNKPKLAVACYHAVDHLFTIPDLLLKLNPQYKVYLRHYTESFTESVLFFVP